MEEKRIPNNIFLFKKPLIPFERIIIYLKKLLNKKYFINKTQYEKSIIRNIIYDGKNKIVSRFKENLIWYDTSEFMKKFYRKKESLLRLNKYYEFYNKYNKLFPNYIPLIESKYIYKNIHKKQKIIDLQQNSINYLHKDIVKTRNNNLIFNKVFNSEIYKSLEKNSEINSAIFGIQKTNEISNNSINDISKIINSIEEQQMKLEKENKHDNIFLKNILKGLKNKNIIINNYYYNNSSVLAKQGTIPLVLAKQQKNNINEKMFSTDSNNILIELRKNKKKKIIKNKNDNNSRTFKNLISFGLINIKDEKNKKTKYTIEDTYSLNNSTKNPKSISNNQKSYYNNNKTSSSKIKVSNNHIFIKRKNILKINYNKEMPNTSRGYISHNNKLFDDIHKLNDNINNNKKNKHTFSINNSIIKNSNIGINIKKRKKINYSLINKFCPKSYCLTYRNSHFFERMQNNNNKTKFCQLSGNMKLKNFSNIISSNKTSKKILNKNKNSNSLLKHINNKRLINLTKKNNIKDLTSILNLHVKKYNNPNKTINIKNETAITDRNYKRINIIPSIKSKIRRKCNYLKEINKNKRYINYKNKISFNKISKLNVIDNQNKINKSDFIIKSLNKTKKSKENLIFKSKFKSNYIKKKLYNIIKIKKKVFHNKLIFKEKIFNFPKSLLEANISYFILLYKELLSKKCFHTTDNSLNSSNNNNEITKSCNTNINTFKKNDNSKQSINTNDNNIFIDLNLNNNIINNMKKKSVIQIKGIKIKNFNKISNNIQEKRDSNSSKKSCALSHNSKKNSAKIPTNKAHINKEVKENQTIKNKYK